MTDQRTPLTISLEGWTHVHTFREGYGEYVCEFYQQEQPAVAAWRTRYVNVLCVYTYRDGRPSSVRMETRNDYLLARVIKASPERYVQGGERSVSPCCTAGHDDYTDLTTDDVYRVVSVAGHGEWAFKVTTA